MIQEYITMVALVTYHGKNTRIKKIINSINKEFVVHIPTIYVQRTTLNKLKASCNS